MSSPSKSLNDKISLAAHLSGADLRALITEAADDPGGTKATPALYTLIDECLSPELRGTARPSVIDACITYVRTYLEGATRAEVVTFLTLLSRAELTLDSTRLQDVLLQYVDRRIHNLSRDVADIAVFVLKRGVGASYGSGWVTVLRSLLQTNPDWTAIDVLTELTALLPAYEYSCADLVKDTQILRTRPEFETNVERRRHKWARLHLFAEEVLNPAHTSPSPDDEVDSWVQSAAAVQGFGSSRPH